MGTRRLVLLLTALLALGALQATPTTRFAPFAQIRSSVCFRMVSRDTSPEKHEEARREQSSVPLPKGDAPSNGVSGFPKSAQSLLRFQRPPPRFAR